MQLVQPSKFTIFRTRSIGCIGMRACEPGLCCNFSNAEKFRCLYSDYGSCMPSSLKEYYKPGQ